MHVCFSSTLCCSFSVFVTNKDYNNYNNFPGIGSSACMVGPLSTPTLTSFYVKLVATVVAIARAAVSCAVTINGDIRLQYRPTDISVQPTWTRCSATDVQADILRS